MANEIRATYDTGFTLYVLVFNAAGQVWRNNAPQQFLAYAPGAIGVYDIPLSEIATNSGQYRGLWPDHANMIAGIYSVVLFEQAGGSPVSTDERIGDTGKMIWNGTAEIDASSIANTWFVSKGGNDSNTGVNWVNAFLTIGAAVAAAANGDTILIASGTYDEQVDLSSKSGITLQGSGWETIVTQNAGDTIVFGHRCVLRNLQIANTGTPDIRGLSAIAKNDICVDKCLLLCANSGIFFITVSRGVIKNSVIIASEYAVNIISSLDTKIDNCTILTDGLWRVCASVSLNNAVSSLRTKVTNCILYSYISTGGDVIHPALGVSNSVTSDIYLENCRIAAAQGDSGSHAHAVSQDVSGTTSLSRCSLSSESVGSEYDLIQIAGILRESDCVYDSTKESGTITHISATASAVQTIDSVVAAVQAKTDNLPADPASVTNQTTLLSRIGAFTGTGINTILGFLKALLRFDASTPSDVGGTFDSATDSVEAIRDRGDAAWTSDIGTGAYTRAYTVTVGGQPLAACRVWVTTDLAGATDPIADGYTNSSGIFTFRHNYAAGQTLYIWRQKIGYNFVNPDVEVI